MYINKIAFIMMMSLTIHFGTAEMIKNKKAVTMMTSLNKNKCIPRQWLQDMTCIRRFTV